MQAVVGEGCGEDGGSVGGGGDDGDVEGGPGDGGVGVGGGGGDKWPSILKVEKVGKSGLDTAIIRRLPDSEDGDG